MYGKEAAVAGDFSLPRDEIFDHCLIIVERGEDFPPSHY